MNNWKESRIYKENVRNLQDTLQRARERNEQEHCATNRIVGIGTKQLDCYDPDIFEKATPMLVDCSNFTYKEFADGKLYFCPKCCNMIKKSYFYCPTCGQNLLWADMNDIRTTVEDNENVKKGE